MTVEGNCIKKEPDVVRYKQMVTMKSVIKQKQLKSCIASALKIIDTLRILGEIFQYSLRPYAPADK